MPEIASPRHYRFIPHMSRRFAVPIILVLAILASSFGLMRLRFDTDILSMLPGDLPEVKGLKAFHEAFAKNNELVMLIEGGEDDAGTLGTAAESLGTALQNAGLTAHARWKPRWTEDPAGLSELLAYLWLNGDPGAAMAQADRLSAGKSEPLIRDSLSRVGTAMEGMDMVMLAHDPFGFLKQPAVSGLMASSDQGGEAFESENGRAHLLFADAPAIMHGYRDAETWLARVRKCVADWQKNEGAGLKVHLTGEPVFSSEIGTAMEKDLSGSISITLGLIGILFWWMQRRLSLLLGLVGVLILVFTIALGVAGWMYGELSIMALSSIEILIGLSVDYGLVICQEAKVAGHDKHELYKASGRPILCGALTTTAVFLALNLGGLPGMAQLGTIVAIGLSAAAVLMLVVYLPFVAKYGVNRAPAVGTGKFLPRRKTSLFATLALSVAAIAVLLLHGLPGAVFDSKIMRPRNSTALSAFENVQAAFPSWSGKSLGVVVEAATDEEMLARIQEASQRLTTAQAQGLVAVNKLPLGWWPDAARQAINRPVLSRLAAQRDRLLAEADAAGYSTEGLALGKSVLEAIARLSAQTGTVFPAAPSAREVMGLFLSRNETGGGYLLGSVEPAAGIDPAGSEYLKFRALTGGGIWLSGWSLFQPAISALVKQDMPRMLVPMFLLLVGMMFAIFRRASDVGLALFAMVISTLLLLAIMSLTGLRWNFVNLMATPLLLGTGIDYAIHVTLSLRRTHGDFQELWNGTGKALLFCGASNVIGFGSLIFSSSEALVSLGIISVIGILLSMLVSIFLLPGWRTHHSGHH